MMESSDNYLLNIIELSREFTKEMVTNQFNLSAVMGGKIAQTG
jgi:hypothetical protein